MARWKACECRLGMPGSNGPWRAACQPAVCRADLDVGDRPLSSHASRTSAAQPVGSSASAAKSVLFTSIIPSANDAIPAGRWCARVGGRTSRPARPLPPRPTARSSPGCPARIAPCVSCRPSARAAWRVTPASASGTVRRNSVQAMLSISSRLSAGEVPGLWSVDTAIGTPAARKRVDRRQLRVAQGVEGAGQQHGDRAGRAHRVDAGLATGARGGRRTARRSAPRARRRPCRESCSACSLTGRPSALRGLEHALGLRQREARCARRTRRPHRPGPRRAARAASAGRPGRCSRRRGRRIPAAARARRGRWCAPSTRAARAERAARRAAACARVRSDRP